MSTPTKISNLAFSAEVSAADFRTESSAPHAYRLVRRGQEYVLQGFFSWRQGQFGGTEWRDLPTIVEQGAGHE